MGLPKRKANRLSGYDYSENGLYFVTICIANRDFLLWEKPERLASIIGIR